MNKTRNVIITVASILLVAGLGSLFVNIGMEWFMGLNKPDQWIPNFVIPVVWSIVYLSFAIILIRWQAREVLDRLTIALLIINGGLNVLWCLVFFTSRLTLLGQIVIVLNLIAAYYLINRILKIKNIYGYILLIYPIWLSIATGLNAAIWILN